MLEDTASDAALMEDELHSAGLDFVSCLVSNKKGYLAAMDDFSPDIILSDYNLPQYDGVRALHDARLRLPYIPFILVTGAIGEDLAIEIFVNGANDYVMKNRLQRLVPAIERALAEAKEIRARKEAEESLRRAHDDLEMQVKERTAELARLNEVLKKENDLRESTEAVLRSREIELVRKQTGLEERNIAMRILLENRDEDKSSIEQNIISNIKSSVFPYLEKLKTSGLKEDQLKYCSEVELHLKNIASSFVKELSSEYIGLSPHEIQVAYLIKEGKPSKEIATILNISLHTVLSHRYKIRIKTGIKSKKINLRTYLQTLK
jgi:DNA-binding NarL/FixJ family response regulator